MVKNLNSLSSALQKALASVNKEKEEERKVVAAEGEQPKETTEPKAEEKPIELNDEDLIGSGELPEITEEEVEQVMALDGAEEITEKEVKEQMALDGAEEITEKEVKEQMALDGAEEITEKEVKEQMALDGAEEITEEEVEQAKALDGAEEITDADLAAEISKDMEEVKDDYAEPIKITDQDLIDSGLLEEITEADLAEARKEAEEAVKLTDEDMGINSEEPAAEPAAEPEEPAPAAEPAAAEPEVAESSAKAIKASSEKYTVWVGGGEVSDSLLSKDEADKLAKQYKDDGYDDVVVEKVESSAKSLKATAKATEMLASAGFKFRTDKAGRIIVADAEDVAPVAPIAPVEAPSEGEAKVDYVEEIPEDLAVTQEQVNLVINNPESEDPFYTILIEGQPVATIHLEDQEDKENKREFFTSQEYPSALVTAMVKGGVKQVLAASKAREFAVRVRASKVAQDMKAEARAELRTELNRKVEAAKARFVESVNLAIAGMNKNFFNNDNQLKAAVYNALASFGISSEQAMAATENVFTHSEEYFKSVVAKAEELMGFDGKSFDTVSKAVASAGTVARQVETFSSKLARGNNPITAAFREDRQSAVTASAEPARKVLRFHTHTK